MSKRTIINIVKNKLKGVKTVGVTSYDYPLSKIINDTNVDFIVVGDTLGSVVYGDHNLNKVDMETMLRHCKAVHRGAPDKFLIGDMPFMSYQPSNEIAIQNAGRFNQIGMDAVKIEGFFPTRVKSVSDSGILVMSHLGLTPQTKAKMGGYKIQSKTMKETEKLLKQCDVVTKSGASMILLEAVPNEVGKIIRDNISIPVFGIGAGQHVDGQLAIIHDLLGMFWDFKPKFIKQYVNSEDIFKSVLDNYSKDVKDVLFPSTEHFYNMSPEELEKAIEKCGSSWKYS